VRWLFRRRAKPPRYGANHQAENMRAKQPRHYGQFVVVDKDELLARQAENMRQGGRREVRIVDMWVNPNPYDHVESTPDEIAAPYTLTKFTNETPATPKCSKHGKHRSYSPVIFSEEEMDVFGDKSPPTYHGVPLMMEPGGFMPAYVNEAPAAPEDEEDERHCVECGLSFSGPDSLIRRSPHSHDRCWSCYNHVKPWYPDPATLPCPRCGERNLLSAPWRDDVLQCPFCVDVFYKEYVLRAWEEDQRAARGEWTFDNGATFDPVAWHNDMAKAAQRRPTDEEKGCEIKPCVLALNHSGPCRFHGPTFPLTPRCGRSQTAAERAVDADPPPTHEEMRAYKLRLADRVAKISEDHRRSMLAVADENLCWGTQKLSDLTGPQLREWRRFVKENCS
jgi:hypothetical protein